MAYTASDFKQDLIILTSGAMIGRKRLIDFYKHLGKTGVNLFRPGFFPTAVEAAEVAGPSLARRVGQRIAMRSPYIVGGAVLGEAVRRAPETIEELFDTAEGTSERLGIPTTGVKKARTKYNKAVSAGMKALKASKFYGKPKSFKDSKKAFSEVNKIASKLNKGKKVRSTGAIGILKKSMSRFLK